MMAFSVLALHFLDHQLLVAKIVNVGKFSLSSSVSNIPFSCFILFQKHVFSQSLVIALMKWLFYIIFMFQIPCCYFPSIRDPLVDFFLPILRYISL
jgi:hypothetical protein